MNFLNIGSPRGAHSQASSPLSAVSQKVSKLFNSSASSAFGKALSEVQSSQNAQQTATLSSALRQNFASEVSGSRADLPKTPSPSGSSGSSGSSAGSSGNSNVPSASTGIIEQIIASEQASAGKTGGSSSSGGGSQQSGSAVTPAGAPTPLSLTQAPSTDPGVYGTMNYFEELNFSLNEAQANDENARRYQNYMNEFQNWQLNGSQGQPPQPPVYESVDRSGFDKWWAQYQQNMSAGGSYTPPSESMFLINAPNYGNGYYGAPGSTQVGTLYNPTGPATAAQVQAATNAASKSSNAV